MKRLLSLIRSHLFTFVFISVTLGGGSKKILLYLPHLVFYLCFPLSFIVSGLTFRSLIHFEFIFMYGARKCSNFILLHGVVQFSQHHLLKRLSLPHCSFLPPLSKISYLWVHWLISLFCILFHWSIFLFLCQYHTVLMTVALWYNLKLRRLFVPAPFFFFKTASTIQSLLCFPMNSEIFILVL